MFESDEAVEAALRTAVEADEASEEAAREQAAAPTPEIAPPAEEIIPEPDPAQPAAEAAAPDAEDRFDSGAFNPDELPEELKPAWRQLQGSYTRKTQELASQLKEVEGFTALGVDAEIAGHAVNLFTRINDPSNWPALYEQLGQVMEQNGIEIPGVRAVAPAAPSPISPGVDDAQLDALVENDPELAPLVATIRAQRADLAKIDSLQARLDAQDVEAAAAREEAAQMRLHEQEVARIQAQEEQIREAYPHYTQDDIDMVYEVSSFHNGDLIAAQKSIDAYIQSKVDAALAGKARPKTAPVTPAAKTPAPAAPAADATIRDFEEEAVEHLRTLQRTGAFE